ncbi:uncharacterized protein [Lolium perenne]|uniref:uncharacterized protein n=1 Tax=Lolium perenne TaxID=4522 RepID=UPI003A996A3C
MTRHAGIPKAIKTLKEPGQETPWIDIESRWCMRHLGANFYTQFRNKPLMNVFKRLCIQNQQWKYNFLRSKVQELTKKLVVQRKGARDANIAAHMQAVAAGTTAVEAPVYEAPEGLCDLPGFDPPGTRRRQGRQIKNFEQWIEHEPTERWSLLHDTHGARYGVMTTNLAESYNFVLRGNRALPLTAIVEGIFMGTVKYYRERREKAQMHMVNRPATPYCSKIMEYMHKKKEKAKHLAVVQIGNVERRYEVRLPTDRFGCGNPQRTHDVKIGNEEWPTCECTCNKPKLLHLPCSHVLVVCGVLGMSEISFVSPYYLKEAVLNTWTGELEGFWSMGNFNTRRFARDQVRNCYPSFTEQFDVLDDRAVIWQPYMAAAVHERYPGGISNLCYRDCAYWMTQSKIIFDVSVEIMAQQRIMRQFGSRQLVDPPPPIAPLPAYVHKYNRKGTSHSSTWWLQRVGSYVAEWDGATTHVWPNDEQFDPQEFAAYLQRYTAATRVRLIAPTDPAQAPPASMHDMYPTQSTAGSRQHAGQLTADLQDEVARYTRQVSSAPLLQRDQHVSWLRRLEDKLRGIYSAITCSRSSDVVQRHLLPPRPSTQQQRRPHLTPTATPRPPPPDRAGGSSWQQHTPSVDDYQYQHHGSRPRLTPTPTPRPPPPDQAGGSSWQQQHTPSVDDFQYQRHGFFDDFQQQAAFDQWQQQQAPFMGGAGYTQGYSQHTASNPSWGASDQDPEHMEYYSTQQNYVGMQTPPPQPTQETQYDPESGSWIPARITRARDRLHV